VTGTNAIEFTPSTESTGIGELWKKLVNHVDTGPNSLLLATCLHPIFHKGFYWALCEASKTHIWQLSIDIKFSRNLSETPNPVKIIKKILLKTKNDHPILQGNRVACYSVSKVDTEITPFKDILFLGCFNSSVAGSHLFIPTVLDLRDVANPSVMNFIFLYILTPKQDFAIDLKLIPVKIADK
jgi:hypothetical protein